MLEDLIFALLKTHLNDSLSKIYWQIIIAHESNYLKFGLHKFFIYALEALFIYDAPYCHCDSWSHDMAQFDGSFSESGVSSSLEF
jgi:hypothetical protein